MANPAAESTPNLAPLALAPLGVEEYIEQAHFFGALAERMKSGSPAQEILGSIREEVLATTKLPMAIDFLLSELRHVGAFAAAMGRLGHYFTAFQTFLMAEAEKERGKFDMRTGLEILRREAEYRAGGVGRPVATLAGLFLFQFEALCRSRLGYDRGLEAVAKDPSYDETWRDWILKIRRQVGMVDLADLVYVHSEHYTQRQNALSSAGGEPTLVLFGEREGRIALANRKKDPLYLFNSLHRQMGYPEVPRAEVLSDEPSLLHQVARRLEQLEKRIQLVEEEQKGGIDLTKFYGPQKDL
jgi:hypothetical protein